MRLNEVEKKIMEYRIRIGKEKVEKTDGDQRETHQYAVKKEKKSEIRKE